MRNALLRSMMLLGLLLTAAAAASPSSAVAGEPAWLPKPERGRGDKCVADTDWMRRNHMTALLHQRDETVHEGLRNARFSLKGCIDCHAVKGADGQPVSFENPKHFCRTCHDYAAVHIDCFECHASRPEAKAAAASEATPALPAKSSLSALAGFLRSVKR